MSSSEEEERENYSHCAMVKSQSDRYSKILEKFDIQRHGDELAALEVSMHTLKTKVYRKFIVCLGDMWGRGTLENFNFDCYKG